MKTETNFSFDPDRDEYIEHYGTPGMKWGVRNAETLRKYAGPKGTRKAGTSEGIVETAINARPRPIKEFRAQAVSKIKNWSESRKMAKSYSGTGRNKQKRYKEFMKTRATTLRAHDPALVVKGMHTLTDSELTAKIARLESEKKVRDIATAKVTSEADAKVKRETAVKAEKERKAAGLGAQMIKTTYNATVNYAGKRAVDAVFDGSAAEYFKNRRNKKRWAKMYAEAMKGDSTSVGETVAAEVLSSETIYPLEKRS